jgi:hypothetical protein
VRVGFDVTDITSKGDRGDKEISPRCVMESFAAVINKRN